MLVYLGEILRQAGFGVMSADNLPDGLMLLRAVRPKAIIIDVEIRAAHSSAAELFKDLADPRIVFKLPAHFSHHEAGEAGIGLLERVRTVIG